MAVYIGVDFHPYEQTVAFVDEADGEIRYKRFLHSDKAGIKEFYRKCGKDAVIGTEATGALWWFEKLLFDNGITLEIGDPRMIRRAALSRHKNDHRDAETILDLLMRGQFPAITPRSEQSREMLDLLNYRHSLVSKRTSVVNQLQAFARSIRTFERLATVPAAGGKGEKESGRGSRDTGRAASCRLSISSLRRADTPDQGRGSEARRRGE